MAQPNPTPAEVFDSFFGPALFEPMATGLLQSAQPQVGERVLDLACATGTVARRVAPLLGPGGRVTGVDINPGMLAVARSRTQPDGAPIDWREGDAVALDLPDGAFDLVLCQQGLQFFPDRAAGAREMQRVLAPGGRAVLNTWQALERHPLYDAMVQSEARRMGVDPEAAASPWSLPEAEAVRALLHQAGFQRIQVKPATVTVHFASSERFVRLTLYAATAFMPEFDWNDAALRTRLIDDVSRDIAPLLERYRDDEGLTFPAYLNVASAQA